MRVGGIASLSWISPSQGSGGEGSGGGSRDPGKGQDWVVAAASGSGVLKVGVSKARGVHVGWGGEGGWNSINT